MSENKWYVFTGGPSTGKTTLLNELQKLGYKTLPETDRVVIDEGIADGKTVQEIRADEKQFQYDVLARNIELEKGLNKDEITFFDRGIPDTLAYLRAYNYEVNDFVLKAMNEASYVKVFLLEPLPHFEQDYARTEGKDFVKKITKLLNDAYNEYGMKPVWVPYMPPKKRLKFILKKVGVEKDS